MPPARTEPAVPEEVAMTAPDPRVRGVDHVAYPTFDGYMIELTRALRPVTPQEDLDAELTIEALIEVTSQPDPSMAALLTRKAELIVERAAAWEEDQAAREEEHRERAPAPQRSGA
jgi:hypothetical protein